MLEKFFYGWKVYFRRALDSEEKKMFEGITITTFGHDRGLVEG